MNQILDNIQLFTTGSTPDTPTANNSVIFISGSNSELFFKNDAGTVYNLSDSSSYFNVYQYTSSGLYSKPDNVKYLQIVCIGAGGGGGSGRRTVSMTNRGGGGAGSGGGVVVGLFPSQSLTSKRYFVTVSTTGGAGGPSSAPGNGIPGGTGQFSSVHVSGSSPVSYIIRAEGGNPGAGGQPGTGTPGASVGGFTMQGIGRPYVWASALGNAATTPNDAFGFLYSTPGGGSGAAMNSNPTTGVTVFGEAFSSSQATVYGVSIPTGSPSATAAGGTGSNGIALNFPPAVFLNITGSLMSTTLRTSLGNSLGCGGHGGGCGDLAGTIPGGKGGDGVTYGAGGGGGGAATTASNGAGGRGGPGYVLIVEYI